MIWAFVLRHRAWFIAGGAALALILLLAGLAWGVKRALDDAYARGETAGKSAVEAKWNAEKAGRAQASAELTGVLAKAFNGLDGSLQRTLVKISNDGDTILVQAGKEMARDPRYASADCSLTGGVQDSINAARGLSGPAAAAGVRDGGVPTSGAAVRFDLGPPGQ